MPRHLRRQANRELWTSWKAILKEWTYAAQVWRHIFFPDEDLETQADIVEAYGDRVIVDPFGFIHIARVSLCQND